ncbi:hypothetical protein [Streptomyces meridianus]|uniref:Uncharacterized protein n=1 Tax=Streptomyces meridianus TaxID=2938945 RepID=A0ABT0X3L2_9ACTN|nr:hypothetical protein [Streptomyces meridianus]MCM2576815.1 hypothetical protein [Streptomyces meridianus]
MPSPRSRAIALAAALSAATGSEPTVATLPDRFRIEVELPRRITRSGIDLIVAALDDVTAYGHRSATGTAPAVLWADIAIARGDHDRGPNHASTGAVRRVPATHRAEGAGP